MRLRLDERPCQRCALNRIDRIDPGRPRPESAFGSGAAVRCERAAAELRAGRPVVIEGEGTSLAVLALDTASPEAFSAMAKASGDTHGLHLTAPRAGVLGIETQDGVLISLKGVGYERACRLGYGDDNEALPAVVVPPLLCAEASALARLALLLPAVVVVPDASGRPDFADSLRVNAGDLLEAFETSAQEFEIVARTKVPLKGIEAAEFVVFRGGFAQRDQVAIIVGDPDPAHPIPVRVHSSCLTGDLFGSLKCDCGDQLRRSLAVMQERGGGVLLYLDQEGRGTGIAAKMRAYGFQCEGLDTIDADARLGFGSDGRRYEAAVAMLLALGYTRIDLLTNNPTKIAHLRAAGIEVVGRTPANGVLTAQNREYLRTKVERAGHMIEIEELPVRR